LIILNIFDTIVTYNEHTIFERDNYMNEFAKRLSLLRERRDISYETLAEAIDSTKSLLWRYEHGKSEPGLTTLIKLAEYFGVTLDWLSGNGEFNEIQFANKKDYLSVINKSIQEGITPEKLEQMIDILRR
jgi:transcriptional regulator with XRE-family HTH domain